MTYLIRIEGVLTDSLGVVHQLSCTRQLDGRTHKGALATGLYLAEQWGWELPRSATLVENGGDYLTIQHEIQGENNALQALAPD